MALAKELTELMGGTISVESAWSEGTTFTILLPVKNEAPIGQSEVAETEPSLPIKIANQYLTPISKTPTIDDQSDLPILLIIEDNPDVVTYIITCLQGLYKIQVAPNGRIGIEMAIEAIPDIIISDVMMPEKDGFEVTQTLKNDERTSHIPIILLTAKADVDSKLEGLERGADAYLAKPFDKKELLIRLQKLIELRQKLQSRYASLSPPPPSTDRELQIEDAFLQKVKTALETYLGDAGFGVTELCKAVGMSRSQLFRKIKALTNKSIATYMRSVRLHKGRELLQSTDMTISEIAYEVGFTSPTYFSRVFSEEFGHPPNEIRK